MVFAKEKEFVSGSGHPGMGRSVCFEAYFFILFYESVGLG